MEQHSTALTLSVPAARHSIQLEETTRRHYEPFQNNKTVSKQVNLETFNEFCLIATELYQDRSLLRR